MYTGNDRVGYLLELHREYNDVYFSGLLMPIRILIKRNSTKDGWYEYITEKRDGPRSEAWYPRRDRLHKAVIVISEGCWEEGTVEGTLIHEMIHQYQAEVEDTATHHDVVFRKWARALELETGFDIE